MNPVEFRSTRPGPLEFGVSICVRAQYNGIHRTGERFCTRRKHIVKRFQVRCDLNLDVVGAASIGIAQAERVNASSVDGGVGAERIGNVAVHGFPDEVNAIGEITRPF